MTIQCDILIVGGSAGGTAAALAAAEAGASVYLIEETDWLGGQLTSQGVCTPDENRYVETFGGTRRYMAFRNAVRRYYAGFNLTNAARSSEYFNPGACWVSRISFEPHVGAQLLREMTDPFEAAGNLRLYFHTRATACTMDPSHPDRIEAVIARNAGGEEIRFEPRYVLDATDTGDLLPLCGQERVDWITGAESRDDTGEPDAQDEYRPDWVQPFTFPFAVRWSPETSVNNVIEPPSDYEALKACQRYHVKHGAITGLFSGAMPWWRYRRVLAAENFDDARAAADLAMINTAGNDYYGGNVIGRMANGDEVAAAEAADAIARARRASLGYLYWLQTECEREAADLAAAPGGGVDISSAGQFGYPELRLVNLFGTHDGCSKRPYVRESRRIRSLRPVLEQEIVVNDFSGRECRGDRARAAFMADSIGIGHYALDIHPNGHGEPNHYVPTRPFQIPLGALIPVRLTNLLPACKNLGVTHLTNGAYRLHPIEWNVGESAGLLATWCIQRDCSPSEAYKDPDRLWMFQERLTEQGIALHWYVDVPYTHPAFRAVQRLASAGVQLGLETDLLFRPEEAIDAAAWAAWCESTGIRDVQKTPDATRTDAAILLYKQYVQRDRS